MRNITYISAGAGSGKTYTLTTKLAQLIADKEVEPEQVILTTFTVKAANEFKEKAKAELYKIGRYDEASRLDNAMIGTIDSVATQLLQKYWYAVGMSPKQGVMDDDAKGLYINQSIANIPTDDDLRFFAEFRKTFGIVDRDGRTDDGYWKKHLKEIVEKSISFDITDYSQSIGDSLAILQNLCDGTNETIDNTMRDSVMNMVKTTLDRCNPTAKNTIGTTVKYNDLAKRYRFLSDIEFLIDFGKMIKGAPAGVKNIDNDTFKNVRQLSDNLWCRQDVYDLQEKYITTIFRLAKEWNARYAQYKLDKRIVDFSDIEHYLHLLLQDKDVAAEIGCAYTHLFVDEFQDCSPIQVKIFMALADVVKQSYWVGDTKQAIYGFRGSDTELTKAIADNISQKKGVDGCQAETLRESWRSVPDLVELTNAAFKQIFRQMFGDDTDEQVELQSAMALHPELFTTPLGERPQQPLRYLNITENKPMTRKLDMSAVAMYIRDIIANEGVKPSDIAVIGRTGKSLDAVQYELNSLGIDNNRAMKLNKDGKACQLLMALIALTVNPHNDLAKATIAYLTQDGMGVGAIIDSKLVCDSIPKDERTSWLSDTMMIERINSIRPHTMYQGVGALVETLVVELDVKNVMEQWNLPVEKSMDDVKALINAAKEYEQRNSELSMPATPSGFIRFVEENDIEVPASGNGVQLITIHGSKGLEWKYVFQILDESLEPMDILKRGLYGINHYHPVMPSADNIYPDMNIRLLPWIFGPMTSNVPECLSDILFVSEEFENQSCRSLDESARLLYVGITRASEVLVLVPYYPNKKMNWFVNSGLDQAGKNIASGDVLGIDIPFLVVDATYNENNEGNAVSHSDTCRLLTYHSDVPSDAPLRSVVPSRVKGKSNNVNVIFRSNQYIKLNSGKLGSRSYSEVGDCIHNVYAAIETLDSNAVEQVIKMHQMNDVLPNADEVVRAWNNLQGFLSEKYGTPSGTLHERPFRRLKDDGTLIVGSIDYVYQTTEGSVLIDYKTFPQVQAVTDPNDTHYAGYYAGQLDTYSDALEAAGEKVIARYIYYPVSGLLVEIS